MAAYDQWLPQYKKRFGQEGIDRGWSADSDTVAQKQQLDDAYLQSLAAYNKTNNTNVAPDQSMLGPHAQPNRFRASTAPEGGFWGAFPYILGALITGGVGASAFGAAGAAGAAGGAGGAIEAGGVLGASEGLGGGLAGTAFNAAADSQLANVAINAAGGDALAGYGGAVSAATPVGSSGFQAALDAYKAAQPYIKGANAVKAVADGNPMSAIASYLPGIDFGDATVNQFANPAIRTAVAGGNPMNGLINGGINAGFDAALGYAPAEVQGLANDVKKMLPMAQAVAAASKGKLSVAQAMALIKTYNRP